MIFITPTNQPQVVACGYQDGVHSKTVQVYYITTDGSGALIVKPRNGEMDLAAGCPKIEIGESNLLEVEAKSEKGK